MNTSSDAAESVVRLSLQGLEVAARVSGSGAKNIAAILVAIAKDQQKVKGKTKLTNLLKSGKELKVFSIRQEDLKRFTQEAKRYGVLFSAIVEKSSTDGLIDIMVRAEDASKINRIVERFDMATVDTATIRSEVQRSKNKNEKEKGVQTKTKEDLIEEETNNKCMNKEKSTVNPNLAKTEKNLPLEHSLENKKNSDRGTDRPSVREEIRKIKEEQKNNGKVEKENSKNKSVTKHKINKSKERS